MFSKTEILKNAINECKRERQSLRDFIDGGGHKNMDVMQVVLNRIYFLDKQIKDLRVKQLQISNQ
ncbi:hypothetical protein M3685_13325 [Heyndrickxia oleronia]|uniref:hypothetical protein n=1 Tax=Heyndrickxia TaxID=2837504 RepID=UPI001B29A239|nr:hypothetical protein [Heyndrickxia oleronia]MCM3240702.1 hypothetical protein [Heyndrickxia oleronia]MCM3454903.1 hypothetical protein [Heyndrickxia oleronia]GIN41386.1 hypothetical protein J19TS1_43350 [Heyndrickxia oleronia]